MALKLDQSQPTSVEAIMQEGGSDERFPLRNVICWNYPARGKQPPVKVYWYDGYFDKTDPTKTDDEGNPLRVQNRPPIVAELEKKYNRDLKAGGTCSSATRASSLWRVCRQPANDSRASA